MRLSHVLIVNVLTAVLLVVFSEIGHTLALGKPSSLDQIVLLGGAIVMSLFLSWPIARLLGVPPLMIFSGPCPRCGRQPPGWWSAQIAADLLELWCGDCGQRVHLWMTSPSVGSANPDEVPTYVLRMPRLLGIWRRLT
jgi:hypothetical protein